MEKKSFGDRLDAFFSGKGFYIVLFLCVAVIGISAWTLLTGNRTDVDDGEDSAEVINSNEPDVNIPSADETQSPHQSQESVVIPETEPGDLPADNETDEQTTAPVIALEPEPVVLQNEEKSYFWPVQGEIEVPYSVTALMYDSTMGDWRTHDGIDICAEIGTQVMAIAAGVVEDVYTDDLYGVTVVIDHGNGVKSIYSNLAGTPTVYAGDSVIAGEIIGAVGDTALIETGEVTHLHLAMSCNGQSADPLDYLP